MLSPFPPICTESASSWLGPNGTIARTWPRYEARAGQLQMADAVEATLAAEGVLFCEAGTGTGKTLAYLIPALRSGRRVVVSTATRALQDQIWTQDIPLIERALGRPVSATLMKGLSNYLCLRRTAAAVLDNDLAHRSKLQVIQQWQRQTSSGELSELTTLREGDPTLALVHSSSDTRLGPRCPHHDRCFVTQMKRKAEMSQLLIVNHHLFFADLALRGPHPGRVLPNYDAVILDEAHQVEDIAALFFGVRVSQRQLRSLSKDATLFLARAQSASNLPTQLDRAEHALFNTLTQANAGDHRVRLDRETWYGPTHQAYLELDSVLEGLSRASDVARRAVGADNDDGTLEGLESVTRRAQELRDALAFVVDDHQKHVSWLDVSAQGHALSSSPVDLAPLLSERLFGNVPSVILTSATLATPPSRLPSSQALDDFEPPQTGESSQFAFFRTRLGATGPDLSVRELVVESPFDFRSNALLYLARDLPEPREHGFAEQALPTVLQLLQAADGGAFILTTSLRSMRDLHQGLMRQWDAQPWATTPPPLMVQGEAPKGTLLDRFRTAGRAVLVATMSFWEGVDVPGHALRLVIIDKIPFAVPTDPLVQARVQHLEQANQNPFTDLFIPSAQMALKQGFGRLIRSQSDRGVVALLDSRICRKGYGQRILNALPPARRTTRLSDAVAFLSAMSRPAASETPDE